MGGIDPIVLPPTHNVFRAILGVCDKLKNRDLCSNKCQGMLTCDGFDMDLHYYMLQHTLHLMPFD